MPNILTRLAFLLFALSLSCLAQTESRQVFAYKPNQHARLEHVELRSSMDRSDSLVVLLDAAFHDPEICCDRSSALRADLENLIMPSLQGIAAKLQGRHVMKGGRWFSVETNYLTDLGINPAALVDPILQDDRVLVEWNRQLYLVKSVSFDETRYTDGSSDYVINQLILLDPLSKTKNHEVIFDRQKDSWGNIQGLLRLNVVRD